MGRLETFLLHSSALPGRPPFERVAPARAFVAKTVLNLPTTRALIDRLMVDKILRRLCGYERLGSIPSESTFSRAFAEFAARALPDRIQKPLIEKPLCDQLVGHVWWDRTVIGNLPSDVVQRVSEANLNELDQWTERVLDAGSLDDVLKSGAMQ